MMDSQLRSLFKAVLDDAATGLRLSAAQLRRERGVTDFLLDAMTREWDARELAANALAELCEQDGSKFDHAICIAVVNLLEQTYGQKPANRSEEVQRLRDCINVVRDPGTREACRQWVESWFPP